MLPPAGRLLSLIQGFRSAFKVYSVLKMNTFKKSIMIMPRLWNIIVCDLLNGNDNFLTDPLLDGAICQLGLREGRLPDAEVWRHQVKGGAGASRHPFHSLQGASQRLHIKTSVRPGPATPASLTLSLFLLSICLSLPSPPEGGRMAPRALATADVTGASYDKCGLGGGERHINLPSHKQHFRWKKKAPLPLSWMVLSFWQLCYWTSWIRVI